MKWSLVNLMMVVRGLLFVELVSWSRVLVLVAVAVDVTNVVCDRKTANKIKIYEIILPKQLNSKYLHFRFLLLKLFVFVFIFFCLFI